MGQYELAKSDARVSGRSNERLEAVSLARQLLWRNSDETHTANQALDLS